MRKALLIAALSLAACNRERGYTSPASATPTAAGPGDKTWVAQPGDLSPEQVRVVQRSLGDRGFAVELTGSYDDQTRVALGDFQRSRGLPATGNLNAETAAALGLDPSDVMPVRGRTPSAAPGPGERQPGAGTVESPASEAPADEPVSPRLEPGY